MSDVKSATSTRNDATSKWDNKPSFKLDVTECAAAYRSRLSAHIAKYEIKPKLVGFLANESADALAYGRWTGAACMKDGIDFELRQVEKSELEGAVKKANKDPTIHGVMIYYPVFGGSPSVDGSSLARMVGSDERVCPACFFGRRYCEDLKCERFAPCLKHEGQISSCLADEGDVYLRDLIAAEKDVEGLCHRHSHCLYQSKRPTKASKYVAPCTPVACMKILKYLGVYHADTEKGRRLEGKVATIINRSDIVGLPLAALLAHEGAEVYSVDIDSIFVFKEGRWLATSETSESACRLSNVIVLGVPSRDYQLPLDCVCDNTVVINVSAFKGVDQVGLLKKTGIVWVPMVGKMTVAMLERNLDYLYRNYHVQTDQT